MLNVIYVLYTLLSHYIFGPVDEEENIEERGVSLKTRIEKRKEETVENKGEKNRNLYVDESEDIIEDKEGNVSKDHGTQLRKCENYMDSDNEGIDNIIVGKIEEHHNEVEEGEMSELVNQENESDDVIARVIAPHFIVLEESDEEDVMADIGVVSVTSKYNIKEPTVIERAPFTQAGWGGPENDNVEALEGLESDVERAEMHPVIQNFESTSHVTFGNSTIVDYTANIGVSIDTEEVNELQGLSNSDNEDSKVTKKKLESRNSFEMSRYDKKMSKDVYLEISKAAVVGSDDNQSIAAVVGSDDNQFNSLPGSQFDSDFNGQFDSDFNGQLNSDYSDHYSCGISSTYDQLNSDINSQFNSTHGESSNDYQVEFNGNRGSGASAVYNPTEQPPKAKIIKYIPKAKIEPVLNDGEWNTFFETSMLTGRREAIFDGLKKCYVTASHPYMLCCDLLITFGITHASGRSIFQRAALKQLHDWKKTTQRLPTLTNKLKALEVSYLCNHTHFEALYTVFDLDITPTEEVVAFIQDKLTHKKKKYIKHMTFIVTELQLQAHFDTAEMLFPLLAMDKMMTIEAYLYTSELAAEFIGHLDFLLSPHSESLQTLIKTLEDEFDFNEKSSQFQFTTDQISTLVKRFLKKYKISPQAAPNLSESKTVSNLKNILFCKYKKGSEEDWTQAILDAVRNSELLQSALLNELLRYGDLPYAATITQSLQIKPSLIPPKVQSYIDLANKKRSSRTPPDTYIFDKPNISWTTFLEEEKEKKGPNLIHPVPNSAGFLSMPQSVHIVDVTNAGELEQCSELLATFDVIGLDSEWRAVLDPTQIAPVALVQLSCNQCVFLLDIPQLQSSTTEEQFQQFAEVVFCHRTVVGYSLESDVLMLQRTVPALGDTLSTSNMVDLFTAHKHITKEDHDKRSAVIRAAINGGLPLPKSSQSQYTGLAKLCETVLSAPLDKTCQITDWVRRPLTVPQRQYAALDAFVLLSLYDKLTARFHPVPLSELSTAIQSPSYTDHGSSEMFEAPKNEEPIASHSLKVVADVPVQSLGKKLRHLGVDCAILELGQDLDYAAKLSLMEGRIILSKDSNCERLTKLTDPGRVYRVHSKDAASQLTEIIQHFNLIVSDSDLFSRCAMCNCYDFIKITPDQAKEIKSLSEYSNSTTLEFTAPVLRRRIKHVSGVKVTMNGVTQFGVKLLLDKVNNKKLNEVKEFWGCYDCGKMYWDGSHLKRFKDKYSL